MDGLQSVSVDSRHSLSLARYEQSSLSLWILVSSSPVVRSLIVISVLLLVVDYLQSAPAPRVSRYNVSCTTPEPLVMPRRYHPYSPPTRHFLPSAAASIPPPASPTLSAHSYIPLASSSPSTSVFTATLTLSPPSDSHSWLSPLSPPPPVSLPTSHHCHQPSPPQLSRLWISASCHYHPFPPWTLTHPLM